MDSMQASSGLCFVIMPFGRADSERAKHFLGVFNAIITPAAHKVGLRAERADLAQEPGNITHDVIRKLAMADVVVADLTDSNPNVFFELGIRHVLRKGGTVHIANRSALMPFDVQAYRVIAYSTDLAEIDKAIEDISVAIKRRIEQPDRSDNPVHDTFPSLPINYFSTTAESLRSDLEVRQTTIAKLQRERDDLVLKLKMYDSTFQFADDNSAPLNIDALLDEADTALTQTGPYTLLRLTQIAEERGREAFIEELRNALKSPYLSESDLSQISNLCQRLELDQHQRAVLMFACQRFPGNMDFQLILALRSIRSAHPAVRSQGRTMVENLLQLKRSEDEGFSVTGRATISEAAVDDLVGALSDCYVELGKDEYVVQMCDAVAAVVGYNSTILRNKARSLAAVGRNEEAEQAFLEAIRMDSSDDTAVAFYGQFLDGLGKYETAFELDVRAIVIDPDDPSRWFNLAIQVQNRGVMVDEEANTTQTLPRVERKRFTIPLLVEGVKRAEKWRAPAIIQRAVGILIRMDAVQEAEQLASGNIPQGDYDYALLSYVQKQIDFARSIPSSPPYRGPGTQPLPQLPFLHPGPITGEAE